MRREPLGRDYRLLWTASTVSNLGDGVVLAALPLFAVTLTRDPRLVAGVAIAAGLPWLLFALVSGALVDRWDRRRVMGFVDAFRAVAFGVLAAAVLLDRATLPLLYVVGFLVGTAETLFDNASQAVMPSVVAKDRLEAANARLYAAQLITNELAGPPLGSLLFVVAAALPFVIDAASFVVAAILISAMKLPPRRPPSGARRSLRAEIGEGLRWLWRQPLVRAMAIMLGVWNLVSAAGMSIFVLYALEVLGLDEAGYGILLSLGAVGGLIGAATASRVSALLGPARAMLSMVAVSAFASLLFVVSSDVWVVALAIIVVGAAGVVWNVITVSLRQSIIPDELLGRVNSVYRLLGWGTIPVGAALGGVVARSFGLRAPYLLGFIALLAMSVVAPVAVNGRAVAAARADGPHPTPGG